MKIHLLLALSVCVPAAAAAATIHKCKDASGAMRYQEAPCAGEAQPISAWTATAARPAAAEDGAAGADELVIGMGHNGHYFIDGAINDHFLNFIIDTGATMVTLPQGFATSAGLKCEKALVTYTGNGAVQACSTRLAKLRFGQITLQHVEAVIMPNLDQPLLGMNVLSRFRVEQGEGQMRLIRKY